MPPFSSSAVIFADCVCVHLHANTQSTMVCNRILLPTLSHLLHASPKLPPPLTLASQLCLEAICLLEILAALLLAVTARRTVAVLKDYFVYLRMILVEMSCKHLWLSLATEL